MFNCHHTTNDQAAPLHPVAPVQSHFSHQGMGRTGKDGPHHSTMVMIHFMLFRKYLSIKVKLLNTKELSKRVQLLLKFQSKQIKC